MKHFLKLISVTLAVLTLVSIATVLPSGANTVTKDGKSYTLYSRTPTKGDLNVLLVRLGFQDYPVDGEDCPATGEETLLSYFDGSDGSVNGYYETSSYGQLHLHCDKVYSYNAVHNRAEYDDAEYTVDDLICEVLSAPETDIDLDKYDSDGDGHLDIVCFSFAGPEGEWGTTWWPHVSFDGDVEIGEKKVSTYTMLKDNASTFRHEFGHILGAMDYYSYNDDHPETIMTYDEMSRNQGDHNGFTKWSYGWLNDDNIVYADKASGDMTISLSPIETPDGGKKIAVIAPEIDRSNGFLDEYFLVEYDSGKGASASMFAEHTNYRPGFRVFHVNAKGAFDDDLQKVTYLNTNGMARDNLIHNVKLELENPSDWSMYDFFYREGDALTPVTSPNSGLSDGSVYNGRYTGISITDFVTGDQPSFKVSFSDEPVPEPKVNFELEADDLRFDAKMTLRADDGLSLREFQTREEMAQYLPYLLTADGTKLMLSVTAAADAREFNLSYQNTSPSVQPETDYTLVVPQGLFFGNYQQPVQEYRQTVTTADFLPITEICEVVGYEMDMVRSNLFEMRENTYGILRAPVGNPNKHFELTEYNLNGEEVYSVKFDVPGYAIEQNYVHHIQVVKLFDGNLALTFNTSKMNYYIKIDRTGHILSDLYTLDNDFFAGYGAKAEATTFIPHLNGICGMLRDYSENTAALTLDFETEPKVSEPLTDYRDYIPIDDETYAAERYVDGAKYLTLYDAQDRVITQITFTGSYHAAFEDHGNITLLHSIRDTASGKETYYADTYAKSGELLARKDVSGSSRHIVEYSVYNHGYAAPNGYYLEENEAETKHVVVFNKDWNHLDTIEFEQNIDYALVGNCGLCRKTHENAQYKPLDYILRFNIADFPVVPAPQKRGDANTDGAVDITDATWIQRYSANMLALEEPALTACDVDQDGEISVIDATWIQRYDLEMKAPEEIGKPI